MALNASGTISLAGTTAGQSIELELGGNGTTAISLNCTNVRNLVGIASGAISLNNFYGKSSGPTTGIFYGGISGTSSTLNKITRINACGAVVGSETVGGTTRYGLAGVTLASNGLFYGGFNAGFSNKITKINICGAAVGSETSVGTGRHGLAGATVGSNGLFYGGYDSTCCCYPKGTMTRINCVGALVGSQTYLACYRAAYYGGATVGSNGLFYGGIYSYTSILNNVVRINACQTIVGSVTTVGTARYGLAGATIGSNGLFYAGYNNTTAKNAVTRINACGAIIGTETAVGTARYYIAGARVGSNGLFYGGYTTTSAVSRINACGAIVGIETAVGTPRYEFAGTGL